VAQRQYAELRLPVAARHGLVLRADALSLLFFTLSAFLWLLTTIYAIGYLEGSPHRSRFFGFFSLCVSATTGIALSGDMVTFVIFYEMLTISTYPLVVHRGTPAALRAGRIYLAYTLGGGVVLFFATVWLRAIAGPLDFSRAAFLTALDPALHGSLAIIFAAADHRPRGQGRTGSAAYLAAQRHGRAGTGQCPAARRRRGQGRSLRHHPGNVMISSASTSAPNSCSSPWRCWPPLPLSMVPCAP
jgi:hypothetical protein